jgi:NAD(P)-dependent dehydrogenase (short-subunit alcohol dehydrogenase family)
VNLSGKVLAVSGSGGALGQAVAAALSGYGARLALLDHAAAPSGKPPAGALALPYLLQAGAGRIVNVGAMGAVKAAAGMGAYAASKAGVAKLTEALADELKDRGITVNAILPSTLDTPKNRLDMPRADFTRWVTPAEAAEVIAFLVSDAARAVTGALIPVVGRV